MERQENKTLLDYFNRQCINLLKEISVDTMLLQIAKIAVPEINACYCCTAIFQNNAFSNLHVSGFTPSEMAVLDLENVFASYWEQIINLNRSFLTNDPKLLQYGRQNSMQPIINSALFVPILFNEEKCGVIIALNKIGALNFSEQDQEIIETLAVYAAVAINNAIVYQQTIIRERALAKRNEDLALLNELAKLFVTNEQDIHQLFNEMMNQIIGYLQYETGEFFLRSAEDPQIFDLTYKCGHHAEESLLGSASVRIGVGIIGSAVDLKKPYLLNDTQISEINVLKKTNAVLNAIVVFPMISGDGVEGILVLGTRILRGNEPINIQFLASIAAWGATLIQNFRLSGQQRRIAILEERERIGMDLHDGVIQSIFGVGLTLENVRSLATDHTLIEPKIKTAIDLLNATIRDIRSYIMNLKPERLSNETLIQSLRRLVNDFHANTLIFSEFLSSAEYADRITEDQANAFFLICKESLSNVRKYACAKRVEVSFYQTIDRFVLQIRDDGVGFDPLHNYDDTHHGISNMFSRAQRLNGGVDIESYPEQGTSITVWLPLSTDFSKKE